MENDYAARACAQAVRLREQGKALILSVESSCDETAVAVVRNGREVLANCIASQIDTHALYGGVVPEIASRMHVEAIDPLYDRALSDTGIEPGDIDAVAVTYGPGLVGALLTGVSWAKALAYGLDVPTGNARLVLSWEVLTRLSTVAALERYLRRLEIELNTNRAGTLEVAEAYHAGAPTMLTRWDAVVNTCTVRRCTSEEAPAEPGAWGAVVLSFTLTNPEEI